MINGGSEARCNVKLIYSRTFFLLSYLFSNWYDVQVSLNMFISVIVQNIFDW